MLLVRETSNVGPTNNDLSLGLKMPARLAVNNGVTGYEALAKVENFALVSVLGDRTGLIKKMAPMPAGPVVPLLLYSPENCSIRLFLKV